MTGTHSIVRGIDPYLPNNGNTGYRVSRYDLEIDYKVPSNRLTGRATITATTTVPLTRFCLDLADTMKPTKVSVNGRRVARFAQRRGKLEITLPGELPAGAAMTVGIRYGGPPGPIRGQWGEVGWEELTDGVLVASQPNGASSWFPCDDHPASKASYRLAITTDSPYHVVSNGVLVARSTSAGHTTWVFEQAAPMATYLATIQIGQYEYLKIADKPTPIRAAIPARLRGEFARSFDRQEQIMRAFTHWFGPYPFPQYTVVVTDDTLEIPIEAQGVSTFGANHCNGSHDSERLIAHELAHQWFGNSLTLTRWKDIWLHEGFACYSEWLWAQECGSGTTQGMAARYYRRLASSPQDIVLGDPGPADMFDDRVYKRGALTLHALRVEIGDANFFALLQDWTARYWHTSVSTENLVSLASAFSPHPLRDFWQRWLYEKPLPPLPVLP
ncbi:M1 family metallopeptidase [Tsukamurella sp. 8F]|uniref:M1 family metallopeptidase n=1 Tax=unclassified Tsukamurella TaxID=2633480 RepID=UPI0023B9359A|nr:MULTISPECIES: M1 family metallopeptidase [unclassified Tsukamurella]MDF0529556.1 M1 family metallopeptidase [Tsukamurella sp. 8J]MDF0585756.1 M1 family metallopeptidase [Tsukamurella sp. 8F]